jgi:hypothetical protein
MAKKKCATKLLLFAAVLLLTYLLFIDNFYVLRLLQNGVDNSDSKSSSKGSTTNYNHVNNIDNNTRRGDRNIIYHDYLSVREFTYIDAYNTCCSKTTTTGGLNCTDQDDEWFTRLMKKREIIQSGGGTLYWAHMRKAGGTSFR